MNSRKGHQGFTSKYRSLGDTKLCRVPISIEKDIKHLMLLLDAIAFDKGIEVANDILDNITDKLSDRLP